MPYIFQISPIGKPVIYEGRQVGKIIDFCGNDFIAEINDKELFNLIQLRKVQDLSYSSPTLPQKINIKYKFKQ
jgi:hypothetical protein